MAISRLWGRAVLEDNNYCSVKINRQPHPNSQIAYAQSSRSSSSSSSSSSSICKNNITSN
jgi:hypothetical protein